MERCHVDITGPHPRTARGSIVHHNVSRLDSFSEVSSESASPPTIIAGDPASVVAEQQRPRWNIRLLIRYRNDCV